MKTSGHKAWLVQKLVRYAEDSTADGLLLTTHSAQEVWVGPIENESQEVMHINMGYDHSFPSEHRNTTFGHDLNHIWTDCWHLPLKTCSDNDELGSSMYDLQWVDCTSSDWLYLRFFDLFFELVTTKIVTKNDFRREFPKRTKKMTPRMGCKNHYLNDRRNRCKLPHKMRFRTKKMS